MRWAVEIGVLGLGRMGLGMGGRLAARGHRVLGYDLSPDRQAPAREAGIEWADSPAALCAALKPPRIVLIMVPAGGPVDDAIAWVSQGMSSGDVIIEGGNSLYKDSIRRAEELAAHGIRMLDAGVSGGVWGQEKGFCTMVGGDSEVLAVVEPLIKDLAPEGGYAYVGKSGAGHFAKMVHNGIEYGMLQAYGEGFHILQASDFGYDLEAMADLWNHGSVVRSWLLELAQLAFAESPDLEHVRGWVEDSGEGRWTVLEAIEQRVSVPVIALSLMMRFRSRETDDFADKVIAALRKQFGGHAVKVE